MAGDWIDGQLTAHRFAELLAIALALALGLLANASAFAGTSTTARHRAAAHDTVRASLRTAVLLPASTPRAGRLVAHDVTKLDLGKLAASAFGDVDDSPR